MHVFSCTPFRCGSFCRSRLRCPHPSLSSAKCKALQSGWCWLHLNLDSGQLQDTGKSPSFTEPVSLAVNGVVMAAISLDHMRGNEALQEDHT